MFFFCLVFFFGFPLEMPHQSRYNNCSLWFYRLDIICFFLSTENLHIELCFAYNKHMLVVVSHRGNKNVLIMDILFVCVVICWWYLMAKTFLDQSIIFFLGCMTGECPFECLFDWLVTFFFIIFIFLVSLWSYLITTINVTIFPMLSFLPFRLI